MASPDKGKQSFISVIIPSYQGERTISYTLSCLLRQSYPRDRFEVIVIDDGSSDRTREIVESFASEFSGEGFQLRLLRNEKKGATPARNQAILSSRGEIVALTDQDVFLPTDWLSQVDLAMGDGVAGIYGEMITDFDNFIEPLNTTSVKKKYLTANEAFLRKDLVEVGLFSDEFPFFRADSELAYKILSRGGVIKYAPSVVAYHPLRRFRWSDLSATVKWSMFDPLLAKKHPEQVKADVLRQPLPGVTVEGLAFIFFIAVVVSSALLVSLIYALVTGASLISVAIVGLSEKRSSYRGKSSKLRLEGSVVSLLVYFCNELGRIAGSVKYRKFLI